MRIQEFADREGLKIELEPLGNVDGYWACLSNTLLKCRGTLKVCHGFGQTQAEALLNYANKIAGELLIFDPHGHSRREIYVPILLTGAVDAP